MENLSALIKSLTPGEEKLVKHFYKLRDYGEYRKRLQLFSIVSAGKAKDEESLAKQVGYTSVNASYHTIKSRLKSDIVCILLMQESSSKFNTPYAQAVFNCRRALLTGEILLSRGVYHEGLNLLKKAARVAEKFELYAERIITEDTLRNHYAGSDAEDELHLGTQTIENNYRLLGQMMNSKKKLYETAFLDSIVLGENENENKIRAEKLLNEIAQLESESESSRASFYGQLSKLNILTANGDLETAIVCAKELLKSIEENPVILSAANKGGIHLEIAILHLRRAEFDNAEDHASIATQLFRSGMLNHVHANTVKFYSQVHSGRCREAEMTIKEILVSRSLKEDGQQKLRHRLNLLNAWFHFGVGKLSVATESIKLCSDLCKEKGPWNFGFALLEAMILIEKGAIDAALYKLDALRKAISRNNRNSYESRVLLGIGVLRHFIRNIGDGIGTLKAAAKELEKLATAADAQWDPSGFEIMRLEVVLIQQIKRIAKMPNEVA
jgi:hypothetical protein